MKIKVLPIVALTACVATTAAATTLSSRFFKSAASAATSKIAGDYVEARTASVMAGACHYNGEFVTTGNDAIMAWSFSSGSYDGADLTGLRAVAEVTSASNLGDDSSAHKSELTVDSSASERQVSALRDLLQTKCGTQLGPIVAVHRAPITFVHNDDGYLVNAAGFAAMSVQSLPDDSCCKQPNLVWYSPLSPVVHRKVGFTETASYKGTIAEPWQRAEENSAFYGAIDF